VFGGHSVRHSSSHSQPNGSITCRSIRELSAQLAAGTVRLGDLGVELATSSLPKESFVGSKQPDKSGKRYMAAH